MNTINKWEINPPDLEWICKSNVIIMILLVYALYHVDLGVPT